MKKVPHLALFIAGCILLVYGLRASGSITSALSEAITGAPTDKSLWLTLLGVVALIFGGVGLFFGGHRS